MTRSVSDPPEAPPAPRVLPLGPEHAGARVDAFLAEGLGISRAEARRLLAAGAVEMDGRTLGPGDKGRPLPGSGRVEVAPGRPAGEQRARPMAGGELVPAVLATGPGWVALDKPAGLPVHPLHADETRTALGFAIARWPEVHGVGEGGLRSGVVHRLDVDTSGVLLMATDERAWQRLRAAFARHAVEKSYRAIVAGAFAPDGGELVMRLPLVVARHRPARVRVARDDEIARGRARVVRQTVRVLEALRDATLVEVRPETGFLHQIRATLAHLGHPLLGDARYAAAPIAGAAPRHMLHAARIAFEEVEAHAGDPADFAACLAARRA